MGIFSTKEEKLQHFMQSHHLNSLNTQDLDDAKAIARRLLGNGLIEFGTVLSGSAEDVAKLSYLSVLVEQNWMIINQLDRLNKKMQRAFDLGDDIPVPNLAFERAFNNEYSNGMYTIGEDIDSGNYKITGSGNITLYSAVGTALSRADLSASPVNLAFSRGQKIECIGSMTLDKQ